MTAEEMLEEQLMEIRVEITDIICHYTFSIKLGVDLDKKKRLPINIYNRMMLLKID